MRFWLLLLMVTLALLSPLIRSGIRHSNVFKAVLPRLLPASLYTNDYNNTSTIQQSRSRMTDTEASVPPTEPLSASKDSPSDAALPKLSSDDFRTYNRLAVMMDAYHRHFRHTWTILYNAASEGKKPEGISLRQFLSYGLQLCRSLTAHHSIEETYIFPELAERMPIFADDGHLKNQHEQIHVGLDKFEEYLRACLYGEKELRFPELKAIMDTFGEVLWSHLDDEVRTLGAESMRKYWTKNEIMGMNW